MSRSHSRAQPLSAIVIATGILVTLLALLGWSSHVSAAGPSSLFVKPDGTGTACTQAQPCALTTALNQARDGDVLYLAQGTYTGNGTTVITITKSITLYGGWDGAATGPVMRDPDTYHTIIDGEGVRRGIYIDGPIAPVLDGLTISNGNVTGLGGYSNYDAGGGIFVSEADVLINNCLVTGNSAGPKGMGGGIFLLQSSARVENTSIVQNTAKWGGGIRVIDGAPVFRLNEVISNTATFGGGIYLMWTHAGTLLEQNIFRGNTGSTGGAIATSGAIVTIKQNLIYENQGGSGGGVSVASGYAPVVLSGNRIWRNSATRGGGVSINFNSAYLENNFITGNQATGEGAGIYINKAKPTLVHNTLAQNTGGDGSGIFIGLEVTTTITNTIIVSHAVGITVSAGSQVTLDHTLWGSGIWANGADWAGDGTVTTQNDVRGNPAFANPAAGDYHIQRLSAARDAGTDVGTMVDIDGDARPVGPAPDIGADEYMLKHKAYIPVMVVRR